MPPERACERAVGRMVTRRMAAIGRIFATSGWYCPPAPNRLARPAPLPVPLNPGDRIERYIIDAALGRGGRGEVYRAHDERLQRSVALKILHPDPSGDHPSSRPSGDPASRMLREARAAAALDHPNVVAIYDVGQLDEPAELRGTTYLAMELIKGRTLRTYVGDARVTMKERIRWLADIGRALAAAHATGIVHRDVKPENVMIRDDGRVKVLDFGIAKRTAGGPVDPTSSTEGQVLPTTNAGLVMGTPMYMAPEQLRGEVLDGRTDQFAWGVVAYELLSGRFPWAVEAGPITLVSQILSSTQPPFEASAGIPPGVADAVMRALSKQPAARFPAMEPLLEAIEGPVNALAATATFTPASGAKGALVPSDSAPRVIVNRAPSSGSGETEVPLPAAPSPRWRRAWIGTTGAMVVVGGLTLATLGARQQARKREAAAAAAASAKAAAPVGCTSNRACAAEHGGEPYVCRASDHACVAIASQDCKAMYEPKDLESDDTVWVGAMFPVHGPVAARMGTVGPLNMDGADFAREEIAQALDTLDGSRATHRARRVALVGCDDAEDAKRAALHLVDDVGVPAILGFRSGQEVIDLAGSLLLDRGVAVVASLTSNPLITRLPQPVREPRLVWRTVFSFEALAEATASIVHDVIEPRQHGAPTRVVLIRNDSVTSVDFADAFFRLLRFNGKSALGNGPDYQEIVVDSKATASLDEIARRVRQAEPTILIDVSGTASPPELARRLEEAPAPMKHPPAYVIANSSTEPLAAFVGANADRRHRVFAIESRSNSTPNARFVIRYNEARNASVTRVLNPSPAYDAFYLLAYASFAIPLGEPVSGSALAGRFSKLVGPGRAIEAGPTGVFDALTALSSGDAIDLEGVASALDFNLATGESPFDFELVCPAIDAHGHANGEDAESGVLYSAKAHRTEGTLKCP